MKYGTTSGNILADCVCNKNPCPIDGWICRFHLFQQAVSTCCTLYAPLFACDSLYGSVMIRVPYSKTLIAIHPSWRWWQFTPNDKICMMTTRLACNRAIESSYWRMDNDSDVGLLMGYVLYQLPVELEFMDLDTFPC
jgi:hypothetical protein